MPWHPVTSEGVGGSDAPPTVASTLAGLGSGDFDGAIGLLRIGTYPDVHEEEFTWNDTAGKWIATREHVMFSTSDAWGMDLGNRSLAQIRNNWARVGNGLPYEKTRTLLGADETLPTGTITLSDASSFATSGAIRIRDNLITYTGKSTNDLTGCSGGTGTHAAGTLVTQNERGGWGTEHVPMDNVKALWDAGLRLQEQASCWLNGSFDHIAMSVAPYYWSKALGGATWTLPPAHTPSGGLGIGLTVTGPADDFVASRIDERPFEWSSTSWTDWAASAPTEKFLIAGLYGRMNDAAAIDCGEVYGYTLRLRWVGTPA
jgi:hypothetical protein